MALRIRHTAVLLLGLVLVAVACGGTEPEPLPDIDATVEARVQEQRDLDAAIDARVQEQLAADAAKEATAEAMVSPDPVPTAIATPEPVATIDLQEIIAEAVAKALEDAATPIPTSTPIPPTPTHTPIPTPTPTPAPTATPVPTPTSVPTATPTPCLLYTSDAADE